jgi:hypothetical protein
MCDLEQRYPQTSSYVVGALVMAWKAHAIHGGTVYEGKTEQVKT